MMDWRGGWALLDAATVDDRSVLAQATHPDVVNSTLGYSRTPLMWMVQYNHVEWAALLIQAKADVNLPADYPPRCMPLALATYWPDGVMVRLLLASKASTTIQHGGMTPLEFACNNHKYRALCAPMLEVFIDADSPWPRPQFRQWSVISRETDRMMETYRLALVRCRRAQHAFVNTFAGRRAVLAPDMVRVIADLIWASRLRQEWRVPPSKRQRK